jgi:VanZ family protein
MMVAVLVICVAAWEPFDVTLNVGSVWGKLKALADDPWQVGVPADEAVQVLRYSWCAILMSAWLAQIAVRGPLLRAVLACSLAGIALEASQLFIGSRMPSLESAAVNVAGALAGGLFCLLVPRIRSPRFWVAFLAAAIWMGAAIQMLSPFSVSQEYRSFLWLPFFGQYANTTTESLSHAFELVLLYFPLGFALAAGGVRSDFHHGQPGRIVPPVHLYAAAIVLAIAMEFPIEYLQGWIVGRYGDVTGVMLAMLGAMTGAWTGGAGWMRFRALTT